jgi:BioD-like phosphotransacetylase family protein
MKALYITAAVTYSGKTALALGIGLKLQAAGRKVGYFKPISTQPYLLEGKIVDEDAEFVRRSLGLDAPAADLAPVIIDDVLLDKLLQDKAGRNFAAEVKAAYERVSAGKDILLVEGAASLREGYVVDASPIALADMLNLPTLGVVRYRNGVMLVDDVLALRHRMGDHLVGVVINSVPEDVMDQVKNKIAPFLEHKGIKVFGVLPHEHLLMSISVSELVQLLGAKVLTGTPGDGLIENVSIGAMTVEAALSHFRRSLHKVVITGGDRADIQAAALETSTTALLLTGDLKPNPTVLKMAEERGVAVLLVPYNTFETVERVEQVFGKTRLAHPDKLNRFRASLDAHLDWTRLFAAMGI